MEEADFAMHAEFIDFGAVLGTARNFLRAVPSRSDCSWQSDDFFGPCVSHKGRGMAPTPGVIPGVGPLPLRFSRAVDMRSL